MCNSGGNSIGNFKNDKPFEIFPKILSFLMFHEQNEPISF